MAKYFLTYSLNNGPEKKPIVFSSRSAAKAAGETALAAHYPKAHNTSAFKITDADGGVIAIGICDASRPYSFFTLYKKQPQ